MNERPELRSEGAEVDGFLGELQREPRVKDISGFSTGFDNLDEALDGLRPGLHLLAGAPGCGKTSLARQVLDQVALHNSIPGIFFSFTESRKELRIKTLARLSGMELRDIRRGSAYLLHRYGVPRLSGEEANDLVASWEKVKRVAQEAKSWLDRIYLVECDHASDLRPIEKQIAATRETQPQLFVVVDDCHRLGNRTQTIEERLVGVTDGLQELAHNFALPVLAVCPAFAAQGEAIPQRWAERITGAEVIMVMQTDFADGARSKTNQASTLHIVRNRSGERAKIIFEFTAATALFMEAASENKL